MKLTLILCTYNEAENITSMASQCRNALDPSDEILVIDDNSPDGTAGIALKLKDPNLRLIVRKAERGLTSALQKGIETSSGELIAWLDSDLSQDPQLISTMRRMIERDGFDAVIGSRYLKGGGDLRFESPVIIIRFHAWLSYILNLITSALFFRPLYDWTSGYIVIRKSLLAPHPLTGDHGEYFIELTHRLLSNNNIKTAYFPYSFSLRERGESKTSTTLAGFFTRGWKYLKTVLRLRLRSIRLIHKPTTPTSI